MKSNPKNNKATKGGKQGGYVSKRVLVRAAGPALRKAYKESMSVAGYVVKAKDGWVVKVDQDGTETKMSRLETVRRPTVLKLD